MWATQTVQIPMSPRVEGHCVPGARRVKMGEHEMSRCIGRSTALMIGAMASMAAFGVKPADAADLGGNCCADLEERIAELEATAARKGNRKVSLTVSGLVNEVLNFWDDGREKNAYQVTNDHQRTRFRFLGNAKIDANWSAGYLLEIGVRGNNSALVDQNTSKAGQGLDVRHSAWWLQNKDLGRLTVGQTSPGTDGITEIDTAGLGHASIPEVQNFIGGFLARRPSDGNLSTLTYSRLTNRETNPGEQTRFNVVRYDTPVLAGFIGTAAWGEDKMWDVALRWAGEGQGFKLAAGIGYAQWTDGNSNLIGCVNLRVANKLGGSDVNCSTLGLSASVKHSETGLFVTGAYGNKQDDNRSAVVAGAEKTDSFYHIKAGIQKNWFGPGNSTLWGEYENGDFGSSGINAAGIGAGLQSAASLGLAGNVSGFALDMWGIGFNQSIDAAAMDLYVLYRHFDYDVRTSATGTSPGSITTGLNDFQHVVAGAIIRF